MRSRRSSGSSRAIAEVHRHPACRAHQRVQRVAVRRDDLRAGERLGESVEVHDLVARSEERHARPAVDVHRRRAHRREHADLRRADRLAAIAARRSPVSMSSPRRRTLRRASRSLRMATRSSRRPCPRRGSRVSAPSGSGAPVMMRVQLPPPRRARETPRRPPSRAPRASRARLRLRPRRPTRGAHSRPSPNCPTPAA